MAPGSESPGSTHGTLEHPFGISVANDPLSVRVPLYLPVKPDSDVTEMADGVYLDCGVDGADGFLAALDAVDEVLTVVAALVEVNLGGANL